MKSEDVEINMDGELEYVEGTNELYNGKSETHYDNGNLQHSGQYKNELMEGVWKYFYEDGKPYLNMTYKLGIMNGLTETYYEDGVYILKGTPKLENERVYGQPINRMELSKVKSFL